jgi:hypothetical protein
MVEIVLHQLNIMAMGITMPLEEVQEVITTILMVIAIIIFMQQIAMHIYIVVVIIMAIMTTQEFMERFKHQFIKEIPTIPITTMPIELIDTILV